MRLWTFIVLLSSAAWAQTYVRPSKGIPFNLTDSVVSPGGITSDSVFSASSYWTTKKFDWTAFSGAKITLIGTGPAGGKNTYGYTCTNISYSYDVHNLNSYVRFQLYYTTLNNRLIRPSPYDGGVDQPIETIKIYTLQSALPDTAFSYASDPTAVNLSKSPEQDPAASVTIDSAQYSPIGCTIKVMVTPLPFDNNPYVRIQASTIAPLPVAIRNGEPGKMCGSVSQQVTLAWDAATQKPQIQELVVAPIGSSAYAPYDSTSVGFMRICSPKSNAYGAISCTNGWASDAGVATAPDPTTAPPLGAVLYPGDCFDVYNRSRVRCADLSATPYSLLNNRVLNYYECI